MGFVEGCFDVLFFLKKVVVLEHLCYTSNLFDMFDVICFLLNHDISVFRNIT